MTLGRGRGRGRGLTCNKVTSEPLKVVLGDPSQEGEQRFYVTKHLTPGRDEFPEVLFSRRGWLDEGLCRVGREARQDRLASCHLILEGLVVLKLDVEELGQAMADLGPCVRHFELFHSYELVGKEVLSKAGR